jgi:hypothetical protein
MVYAPDPPDAEGRPSILTGVAGYIIVTEFCERLAYFGFAGSLVLFFQVGCVCSLRNSCWEVFLTRATF